MSFGDALEQTALSVAIDNSGNVIAAGTVKGTVDFGGGPITTPPEGSYFVTKRNSAGEHLWTKLFGDPLYSSTKIAIDPSGNVFISCVSSQGTDFGGGPLNGADDFDIYVAKLDPTGNHVWSKTFGSIGPDTSDGIRITPKGTLLLAGNFSGSITFGGGEFTNNDNFTDFYLAEFNTGGDHVWSKSYQGSASLPPFDMELDSLGNIIIGGGFFGKEVNFGGDPLAGVSGMEIFLAKFDATGNHIWSKRFGGTASQSINDLVIDAADNIYIVGQFSASFDLGGSTLPYQGGSDAFVARLGPAGNHLWSKPFGDSLNQLAQSVATDSSGKVIVGGTMTGIADFGGGPLTAKDQDIFLVTLTSSGDHVWSRRFGETDAQIISDIATDGSGNLAVIGQFQGSIDFGGTQLTTAGSTDVFIAKLAYP
jgi:hypothetical protein